MADRKRTRSSRSTLEDANEEHRLWKEICIALVDFDRIQKRIALVLKEINTILSTNNLEQGIPANLADQLKQYYAEGIELSMKELQQVFFCDSSRLLFLLAFAPTSCAALKQSY